MICTPCQQEIPEGAEAIFAVDNGSGRLVFGFTCCHRPVGDVAVILGSRTCLLQWILEHPEYAEEIGQLFQRTHKHKRGKRG